MSWTLQWQKIIFSDEKRWNLDGPDGRQYYWHDLRKEPLVLSKPTFGGGSVMVWGAFAWGGKYPLKFITGNVNSEVYQNIITEDLLPVADEIAG